MQTDTTLRSNSLAVPPVTSTAALRTGPRPPAIRVPKVESLTDLYAELFVIEGRDNPDAVLPLRDLRMNDGGLITIPGHGDYALTDWARRQLAEKLGIKWERWFALLSEGERAEEINKRLVRSAGDVRLRTTEVREHDSGARVSVLRAFVSPSYTPFSDAALAGLLSDVLGQTEHRVARVSVTDMTVSYALYIGHPVRAGDSKVGDLQGGIFVRNSGVGYASLVVTAHLMRLICLNGMLMPVKEPVLVACVHQSSYRRS